MNKTTLKRLIEKKLITGISTLKENKSGYPFVVVFGNDRKTVQSLYFGQKTSTLVKDNFKVGDNIINFLKDSEIVRTESQQEGHLGEVRFKISNSNSDYVSGNSLMDAFELTTESEEFDYAEFSKTFAKQENLVPQA